MGRIIIGTSDNNEVITTLKEFTIRELIIESSSVYLSAPCGGNGLCGKCRIRIREGDDIPAPKAEEIQLLSAEELGSGVRLACKTVLPIENNYHIEILDLNGLHNDTAPLKQLDGLQKNYLKKKQYAFAVDAGTTTIVVYLLEIHLSTILGHYAESNRQSMFGSDVINRISYVEEHSSGLEIVNRTIIEQINAIMENLLYRHAIHRADIKTAVIVGNPTMMHIVVGADPLGISHAPFTPAFTEQKKCSGEDLGLSVIPHAQVTIPGFVSAYVGSDITAGVYAVDLIDENRPALFIDIGTNGEVALWNGRDLYCCSTAAGPSLEGGKITKGMGPFKGAIDHAWLIPDSQDIHFSTIGGGQAVGICGSGIVDITACLLEIGMIDSSGYFKNADQVKNTKSAFYQGRKAFFLNSNVLFSEKDVREVQLAKAAIAGGIQTLLVKSGVEIEEVGKIIIAGCFGSFINVENAMRIGLIPETDKETIQVAGNCAGRGAIMSMFDKESFEEIETIRRMAQVIELSSSVLFYEHFVEHLSFPERRSPDV